MQHAPLATSEFQAILLFLVFWKPQIYPVIVHNDACNDTGQGDPLNTKGDGLCKVLGPLQNHTPQGSKHHYSTHVDLKVMIYLEGMI